MTKYTLFVGLNDKDSKIQEINTIDAYKMSMNTIKRYCDGGTISEAQGFYTHENGAVVVEPTLRIELLFVEKETVKKIVDDLKALLNQESIAVSVEKIESELW